MQEQSDSELLREYVENRSETAFTTLVARHVSKVYSVALRHTRNASQAEEITQAVFVILARKAPRLSSGAVLSGWLYQTARLTSVTFLRSEFRRARREQEAHMQSSLHESTPDAAWEQLAPMLDEAMATLRTQDRNAVVLRFFDGKSLKDTGIAMAASEDATRKRVGRAVEKLRAFFVRRGVTLSTAVISTLLTSYAVQSAPAHLVTSIGASAAGGTAVTASTLNLVEGVLKLMGWLKLKTAALVGAAVLVTAGTTTVAVNSMNAPKPAAAIAPLMLEGWGRVINPDGDCALTLVDHRLVVQIPGSDHAFMPERRRTNAPRVMQEIYGDFSLQVKVSGDFPVGARTAVKGRHPYQDGGLFLWLDEKNNLKLARAQTMIDGKPQSYINFETRQNGEYSFSGHQPPGLFNGRGIYLRVRRRGDTFEVAVSGDGRKWISQMFPSPEPVPKKMEIGLIAQQNTYSPLRVQFEDFRLERGSNW